MSSVDNESFIFSLCRFFMEIDPCKGSKIAKGLKKKKTSSISPKVLSLYNFLKERAEEQDQEN